MEVYKLTQKLYYNYSSEILNHVLLQMKSQGQKNIYIYFKALIRCFCMAG